MNKNLIILGLCLVVAGMLIAYLLRPVPVPTIIGDLTVDQEEELKATVVSLEIQNDSLWMALEQSKAKGKQAESAFKIEIKAKVKTIAELKSRPEVVEIIENTSAIDSLHEAYDDALMAYEGRVISLTDELQHRDQLNGRMRLNFEERLVATQKLLSDREVENAELKKENRKLRRKLTGTKVIGVIVILGIGALAL